MGPRDLAEYVQQMRGGAVVDNSGVNLVQTDLSAGQPAFNSEGEALAAIAAQINAAAGGGGGTLQFERPQPRPAQGQPSGQPGPLTPPPPSYAQMQQQMAQPSTGGDVVYIWQRLAVVDGHQVPLIETEVDKIKRIIAKAVGRYLNDRLSSYRSTRKDRKTTRTRKARSVPAVHVPDRTGREKVVRPVRSQET